MQMQVEECKWNSNAIVRIQKEMSICINTKPSLGIPKIEQGRWLAMPQKLQEFKPWATLKKIKFFVVIIDYGFWNTKWNG
jgi:hypothetical protein